MPDHTLTSLARIPLGLLHAAEKFGGDGRKATSRHLLGMSDPDGRVPLTVVSAVWRDLVERDADPALGLRLGRCTIVRRLGLVGYLMAASRNLGDALDRLSRYYAILREGVECRVDRGVESVTITLHDRATVDAAARQQVDARLAAVIAICRQLTAYRIVPDAVHLPYGRPRRVYEHQRTFGAAILLFDRPQPALVLPATSLARGLRTADATLLRYLRRLADEVLAEMGRPRAGSVASRVAEALVTMVASGSPAIGAVGAMLGIGERTLQRRLYAEGTTFAEVLDRVRRDEAERLLLDPRLTIEAVARRLGYSEPSTFYRAFRRWRATSPAAFRGGAATRRPRDDS